MQLSNATVANVPSTVQPIGFNRSEVRPGILHFGVGQFFRSHLLLYVRNLLMLSSEKGGMYNDWGVIGVNVIKGDREKQMYADFKNQDCLYTLTLTPSTGSSEHFVMGSMLDYIYAPEETEKLFHTLSSPAIKILSLTVTEGGYNIDEKSDSFDLTNAAVKRDLQNPHAPLTTFGYIVEGLRRRREAGVEPFTIMSCDNLRHNGDVAKKAVLGYARALDADLAKWIEANVSFPNSMVDCITPATTPSVAERLNKMTNVHDAQPVLAEDFHQWVIEDKFNKNIRPPWDLVGATFSDDVAGYEQVKQRILNSSHITLTFPAVLLGMTYVHEGMQDADISRLVHEALDKDVIPTLRVPTGMDVVAYKEKVLSRFLNPALGDQLLRIAGDATSKVQVFWTVTISALLKEGRDHSRFAFGVATFIEMLHGKDETGKTFPVVEPKIDEDFKSVIADSDMLKAMRLCAFDAWRALNHEAFDRDVVQFRQLIRSKGVRAAMPLGK